EAFGQTQLCTPGDIAHGFGLTLLPYLKITADARTPTVAPGCLDEDSSGMFVAALGDTALMTGLAAGEFRGHKSQVSHQCAWMREAAWIANLSNDGNGGNEVKAAQTHQRLHQGVHVPLTAVQPQCLGYPLEAFMSVFDRVSI